MKSFSLKNSAGFTFVEVLIAIAILALGFIGLSAMSGNAIRGIDSAKKLSAAINLAEAKLEALKAVPYSNLEAGDTTGTPSGGINRTCTPDTGTAGCGTYKCTPTTDNPTLLNSVNYEWSWTAEIVDVDGDSTCSSSGDGLKKVTMTVKWTDTFGERTAALATLRAK